MEPTEGDGEEELTPAQEKAVYALLTCRTFEEAALSAGVSRSTLQRWRALPAFVKAYQDKRLDLIAGTTNALRVASAEAVNALVRNLTSGKPTKRPLTSSRRGTTRLFLLEQN